MPVDDVDTLASVMAELMADGASREALGREARNVRQRYAPEKIMEIWRRFLLPADSPASSAGERE